MADPSQAMISLNPAHWKAAREAAAWVVMMDARLIGIPKIRPELIRVAARQALGSSHSLSKDFLHYLNDQQSFEAINDVIRKAREAAIGKIETMAPMRKPRKKSA